MSFLGKIFRVFSEFLLKRGASADMERKENRKDLRHPTRSSSERENREMVYGIFKLDIKEVREIMVPRMDMVCMDERLSLEEIKELVKKEGHSRFPLIKDNIDNVKGIIYIKDLFMKAKPGEKLNLEGLARKTYFVPESKKVNELLKEMKKAKIHIAVVVDEYGGISGLVTLEDILEEIVGEIRDEFDMEEEPFKRIDENTFIVDAKVSLEDLMQRLGMDSKPGEFETLGGLIYDLMGGMPQEGEILRKDNLQFYIEKKDGQRIKTVRVTKLPLRKANED